MAAKKRGSTTRWGSGEITPQHGRRCLSWKAAQRHSAARDRLSLAKDASLQIVCISRDGIGGNEIHHVLASQIQQNYGQAWAWGFSYVVCQAKLRHWGEQRRVRKEEWNWTLSRSMGAGQPRDTSHSITNVNWSRPVNNRSVPSSNVGYNIHIGNLWNSEDQMCDIQLYM